MGMLYNINKWIITDIGTDEPIAIYDGTFMDVMHYASRVYEDGTIDIETYDNWLNRQVREKSPKGPRSNFEEGIANGWIYG